MNKNSDEYLIAQIVLYDNHKAFKKLLDKYQNGIRNLIFKLVNFNEERAEDLSQEAFIKIYKNLKSFKGQSKLSSWLYKLSYNVFLDHQKKYTKQEQIRKDYFENRDVESNFLEKNIENKIDVETIISFLKPEEKVAIQLSFISGFPHKEIAEIMDCPIGTVKSYINRGKERIKKNITKNG